MGTFEIQRARPKLGRAPTTAVRSGQVAPDVGTGAAIGQALLGSVDIWRKYDIQQANTQLSESQRKAGVEMNDFKIRMKGNLDPDTYQKDYAQTLEKVKSHAPKNGRGAKAYGLWMNTQTPTWQVGVDTARIARSNDNWKAEMSANIAAVASGTDPLALAKTERMIARKQLGPSPLDKTDAAKLLTAAREADVEGQLGNLKKAGVNGLPVMVDGKPENAFDQARELVNSTNVFSSEESLAELKKIDMMEAFAKRKSTDLKFSRNMAINDTFVEGIVNNNLTPDTIANSKLDDGEAFGVSIGGEAPGEVITKASWAKWAEDSYNPPPTELTPAGADAVNETVIDFSKLSKISKEQAYNTLLEERYGRRSITNEAFEKAINRINNPYPTTMLPSLEAQIETNVKAERGFFKSRKAEGKISSKVNAAFMDWIDAEFEQGNVPTATEMNEKSAQLRSGEAEIETEPLTEAEEARRQELIKKGL